jgi:murein DD-endopeptidase MepM/ murein hydrolase activator NlpD
MERDAGGVTPAPDPPKPPVTPPRTVSQADILNLISSNAPGVYISFPFRGQGNAIYAYGKGHGTQSTNEHSGIDIWMPDETPVNCLFDGEVICVGTTGAGLWGNSCGYFKDDNGGIGKIEVLHDAYVTAGGKQRQIKIVYGHMSSATVRVGERVKAGQRIGRSGIAGAWPHIHVDVAINAPELNNPRIWNNPGEYHLLDPIPAILEAMGGKPLPKPYAQRLPIPQPQEFDDSATVVIDRDGVPLLQRANMNAAHVDSPFEKGDEFEAVYQVMGTDKKIYWVSKISTRVPVDGTHSDEWPTEKGV